MPMRERTERVIIGEGDKATAVLVHITEPAEDRPSGTSDAGRSEEAHVNMAHTGIIQTLDREIEGVYLEQEFFKGSLDAWNDVPLIFAQDHPDMDAFDHDPEAELERIGGRLINGRAEDTHIEQTGHPRLMTTFMLDDDEIEQGIADGRISISTGFFAKRSGKKLAGPVRPHHVLFFKEGGENLPGDKGTFIIRTHQGRFQGVLPIAGLTVAGEHDQAIAGGPDSFVLRPSEYKHLTDGPAGGTSSLASRDRSLPGNRESAIFKEDG